MSSSPPPSLPHSRPNSSLSPRLTLSSPLSHIVPNLPSASDTFTPPYIPSSSRELVKKPSSPTSLPLPFVAFDKLNIFPKQVSLISHSSGPTCNHLADLILFSPTGAVGVSLRSFAHAVYRETRLTWPPSLALEPVPSSVRLRSSMTSTRSESLVSRSRRQSKSRWTLSWRGSERL